MSYLIAEADDGRHVSVSLSEPVEIGRGEEGYMVEVRAGSGTVSLGIADATVSRNHARLYTESGRLMLRDLGSRNGTLLNDRPLPAWRSGVQSEPLQIIEDSNVKFGHNTLVRITLGERTLTPEEWGRLGEHPS
jgi:pSer/pThr/pTyr-binding forkhead associated (FHA) protein